MTRLVKLWLTPTSLLSEVSNCSVTNWSVFEEGVCTFQPSGKSIVCDVRDNSEAQETGLRRYHSTRLSPVLWTQKLMQISRQRPFPAWSLPGPSMGMSWMLVKCIHLWITQTPRSRNTGKGASNAYIFQIHQSDLGELSLSWAADFDRPEWTSWLHSVRLDKLIQFLKTCFSHLKNEDNYSCGEWRS